MSTSCWTQHFFLWATPKLACPALLPRGKGGLIPCFHFGMVCEQKGLYRCRIIDTMGLTKIQTSGVQRLLYPMNYYKPKPQKQHTCFNKVEEALILLLSLGNCSCGAQEAEALVQSWRQRCKASNWWSFAFARTSISSTGSSSSSVVCENHVP